MSAHFRIRHPLPTGGEALPLNAVVAGGHTYLRVTTACEVMLHLAPLADDVPTRRRRAAVNRRYSRLRHGDRSTYDLDALLERCWGERTLCGLTWWEMASQEREVELAIESAETHRAGYACPWCERDAASGSAAGP
jgi:hypothetical protein